MDTQPYDPNLKNNPSIQSYPSNSSYPSPTEPTINVPKKPLPGIKPAPVLKPKS